MDHYVRPADDSGAPAPISSPARSQRLHQRLARLLVGLVADWPASRRQSTNLIRRSDGGGTVISSNHGGSGAGA